MYSANDGSHTYQIPATVAATDPTPTAWAATPGTLVGLGPDSTTGGVMITTLGAGTVTVATGMPRESASLLHLSW